MKYKAVIFDQDGTLVNTIPLLAKAMQEAAKDLTGKKIETKEIIKYFGPSEKGTLNLVIPGYEKAFDLYIEYYEKLHDEICPAPFEGIRELLEALKKNGIKIALVTGKGVKATNITMKKFEFDKLFEFMLTGSEKAPNKTKTLPEATKKLGLDISECLYIGDESLDVKYCREVGMDIASVAWATSANPEELKKVNPGMVFNKPADLLIWILNN